MNYLVKFPYERRFQLNRVKQRAHPEVIVVVVILGHVFSSPALPTFSLHLSPSLETASIKAYCLKSHALSHPSHLMQLGQMTEDCDLTENNFLFKLLFKIQ